MRENEFLNRLTSIAVQLSAERDVEKLLHIILESCIEITNSDAGSIYTVENDELHFEYTLNHSVDFPFSKYAMPLDRQSISGNCALNKTAYNISSMKKVEKLFNIKHNESFDKSVDYRTINMLVVPMMDYYGEVIGVMQLINKKEEGSDITISGKTTVKLPSYTDLDEQITSSLASQAAILIARSRLYNDLSNLLDSIISTLSAALELRDPVTAGHSRKVADYAVKLARAVNDDDVIYKDVRFSENQLKELEIASLLHDIGKIGISESILQKQNRLSDEKLNEIEARLYLMGEIIKNGSYSTYKIGFSENVPAFVERIRRISDSNLLEYEDAGFLNELKNESPIRYNGRELYFLNDEEYESLSIESGNLTKEERDLINMHAKYSEEILERIDWGKRLHSVPKIASRHHERLNGMGYPYGLDMTQLSIRERILAIADIFDALTAVIRPYKEAVSKDKAYKILDYEVRIGTLDRNLVDLFKTLE